MRNMTESMMIVVFVLLGSILQYSSCQEALPASPCPGIMYYEYLGNQWVGRINAPNPPPYGSEMKIMVKMSLRAQLPNSYVGKIEPSLSTRDVLQRIGQNLPIPYIVFFPLLFPLPRIVSIIFDGRRICSGRPANAEYTTIINIEYTFRSAPLATNEGNNGNIPQNYYSADNALTNNQNNTQANALIYPDNPNNFETDFHPIITTPTLQKVSTTPRIPAAFISNSTQQQPLSFKNDDICGTTVELNQPLVFAGEVTDRGDFPWLVAFHFFKDRAFFCAGSLISTKAVLTAAHCMMLRNNTIISPNSMIIRLGAYSLEDWTEDKSEFKFASSIRVRPDFNSPFRLSNDIAVVVLNSPVIFNEYIRPICLWTDNDDQDLIVGKRAIIVGWGQDENKQLLKDGPRRILFPIVSTETCRASHPRFHETTSDKTLCAGMRDGRGPCRGDSGGGLFLRRNGRFVIRGIISNSLSDPVLDCDLNNYVVYTDVAKYIRWISESIQ